MFLLDSTGQESTGISIIPASEFGSGFCPCPGGSNKVGEAAAAARECSLPSPDARYPSQAAAEMPTPGKRTPGKAAPTTPGSGKKPSPAATRSRTPAPAPAATRKKPSPSPMRPGRALNLAALANTMPTMVRTEVPDDDFDPTGGATRYDDDGDDGGSDDDEGGSDGDGEDDEGVFGLSNADVAAASAASKVGPKDPSFVTSCDSI